jgi:hypothetical protein
MPHIAGRLCEIGAKHNLNDLQKTIYSKIITVNKARKQRMNSPCTWINSAGTHKKVYILNRIQAQSTISNP